MPRQRKRRRLTNHHRHQPVRHVQASYRNERSLSAIGISCLDVIQANWTSTLLMSHHIFGRFFIIKQIHRNLQRHHPFLPTFHLKIALRSCIHSLHRLFDLSASYAQTDYQLADILPHEESVADYGPPRPGGYAERQIQQIRVMTRQLNNTL